MPEALLFGASGQIGEALRQRLQHAGWQVTAVSRHSHAGSPGVRWLRADLAGPAEWPLRTDAIFSCGPLDLFSEWYAANGVQCPRVVAFGSTSADAKQDSPDASERALALLLRRSEERVLSTAASRGASATILRPTLVYGAGRDRTLSSIAGIAARTGWFVLPTGANGLRQPVHVQDLAKAAHDAFGATAAGGRIYALPGGETLPYREMVARTLASLRPPARLLEVPAPMFNIALSAARMAGRLQGAGAGVLARMHQDLVFDRSPAADDFGYAPRGFDPAPGSFRR